MENKEFKRINENWNKFLDEETKKSPDQGRIDEAIISGALLAKLIFFLSQKENIKKVTSALLTRKDLPPSVRTILEQINIMIQVVDKELPTAARKAVELRGRAPDSWVGNLLVKIFAHYIKSKKIVNTLSSEKPEEIGVVPDEDMEEIT
jgi:hypothetical protein